MATSLFQDTPAPTLNFRVIAGKHRNSKIYVKEPYTYVIDRSSKSSQESKSSIYLKCRIPSCPARAHIVDGFLNTSVSRQGHSCNESESSGMAKISSLEVASKMKTRAELEMTGYWVSNL